MAVSAECRFPRAVPEAGEHQGDRDRRRQCLVYDDPVNNSIDFCLAKFQGVSAEALQANFDQNAMFQ